MVHFSWILSPDLPPHPLLAPAKQLVRSRQQRRGILLKGHTRNTSREKSIRHVANTPPEVPEGGHLDKHFTISSAATTVMRKHTLATLVGMACASECHRQSGRSSLRRHQLREVALLLGPRLFFGLATHSRTTATCHALRLCSFLFPMLINARAAH